MTSFSALFHVATSRDFDIALEVLVAAFDQDPVWDRWAFPSRPKAEQRRRELFALWLSEALPLESVFVLDGCAAVSLWYPPGSGGDSDAYRSQLHAFAKQLGSHADKFLRGSEMISLSQPTGDFWYLALLAVSPKRRGLGLGMKLLRSCLEAPPLKLLPAYLETTTPANARRYAGIGFCEIGDLELPDGPTVTRMWRDVMSGTVAHAQRR